MDIVAIIMLALGLVCLAAAIIIVSPGRNKPDGKLVVDLTGDSIPPIQLQMFIGLGELSEKKTVTLIVQSNYILKEIEDG